MLVPLRVGVSTQVQQPQVLGPLAEAACRDLGRSLSHLDRVVGVGAGEPGQQVRPVALQAGLEHHLVVGRLAIEQSGDVRSSHRWSIYGAGLRSGQPLPMMVTIA